MALVGIALVGTEDTDGGHGQLRLLRHDGQAGELLPADIGIKGSIMVLRGAVAVGQDSAQAELLDHVGGGILFSVIIIRDGVAPGPAGEHVGPGAGQANRHVLPGMGRVFGIGASLDLYAVCAVIRGVYRVLRHAPSIAGHIESAVFQHVSVRWHGSGLQLQVIGVEGAAAAGADSHGVGSCRYRGEGHMDAGPAVFHQGGGDIADAFALPLVSGRVCDS